MPPKKQPTKVVKQTPLQQIVADVALYPTEAYDFIQQGLSFTVQKIHGEIKLPDGRRHVSGRQLCQGLREYALMRWGLLARIVLCRWNVTSTLDFGRIVFALVDAGHMQKTEDDSLEDFRAVFDFRTGFETGYRIPAQPAT